MSTDAVCRVCLINNLNLYEVRNYLQDVYEGLTGEKYNKVGYPVSMCYICLSALRKCHKFMEAAQDTENMLKQWYNNNQQMVLLAKPLSTCSVRKLPLISLDDEVDTSIIEVKIEPGSPPTTINEIQQQYQTPGPSKEIAANNHCLTNLPQSLSEVSYIQIKIENIESNPIIDNDNQSLKEINTSNKTVKLNIKEKKNMEAVNNTLSQIINKNSCPCLPINDEETNDKNNQIENETTKLNKTEKIDRGQKRNLLESVNDTLKQIINNKTIIVQKDNSTLNTDNEHKGQQLHNSTNLFICNKCSCRFDSIIDLSNHIHAMHGPTIYTCDKCNFKTKIQLEMTCHQCKIKEEYSCNLCCYKCKSKNTFNRHMQRHANPFSCESCSYTTMEKWNLHYHILKKHTDVRPFTCDICNKKFVRDGDLKTHMKTHNSERPFTCDVCGYKALNKGILRIHMRIHTGEKPYTCDICGYRTKQSSALQEHKRRHAGIKPLSCDTCGSKFLRRKALQRHIRSHTGERPFSCDNCSFACASKSGLRRHVKTHTGEKPHACDICTYKCIQKGDLTIHMRKHSGEKPFSCDVCSYKCAQKNRLTRHMLSQHDISK